MIVERTPAKPACQACEGSGKAEACPKCKGSGRRAGGVCRNPGCAGGRFRCRTCRGLGYPRSY